jgi:hypothetical protein
MIGGGSSSAGKNFLKKGFKQLKGMLQLKEKDKSEDSRANQNLIFNELSRFVNYFICFGFAYEQANELLVSCCEQF